jgi:hypothetical protein
MFAEPAKQLRGIHDNETHKDGIIYPLTHAKETREMFEYRI